MLTGIALKHSADDVYAGTSGAPCRRWTPGSQRSPTGLTTYSRRPMPMRTCAASKSPASGAISSTVAPDRQATIRTRRTPWTLAVCATSSSRQGPTADCAWAWRCAGRASPPRSATPPTSRSPANSRLPISLHVGMAGTADAITTLERFGLLGADVNYAHGNMLTDEEFDLIAASRGTLSITPSTDMLMQFGTYPGTGRAVARSIVSGFGVDTICSAGTDLFSEMRLALAAERSRANAPALARGEQVPTVDLHQRDMLRLATLDGARVWNLDDQVGSLTPGKQADIAIIDMRSPHLDGFGDPVAVMVLGAGSADVETVIVGGDVVKRDGQLVGARVGWPGNSCTKPATACAAAAEHYATTRESNSMLMKPNHINAKR